jgi:hypothetical protein
MAAVAIQKMVGSAPGLDLPVFGRGRGNMAATTEATAYQMDRYPAKHRKAIVVPRGKAKGRPALSMMTQR